MASPFLAAHLLRFAALPWYLGGSPLEDTLAVLAHTGWQFTLLAYYTLTFLREPAMVVQTGLVAWWFLKRYHLPDIPLPHLPETTLTTSWSRPQISICGQYFDPQLIFSPTQRLRCPEPLATALVNAGCAPPSIPVPTGLKLLPIPAPPPPFPPGLFGPSRSVSLFEISISVDFDFTWLIRWWSLADLSIATNEPERIDTGLPVYYERWRQFYEMSKFFSELFANGHMPIG